MQGTLGDKGTEVLFDDAQKETEDTAKEAEIETEREAEKNTEDRTQREAPREEGGPVQSNRQRRRETDSKRNTRGHESRVKKVSNKKIKRK